MNVFTRIAGKRDTGSMEEPENWEAFLVTAVTNACRDIVKATHPAEEIDDSEPQTHRGIEPDPTGDAAVDRLDHATRVDRAKAALETLDERSWVIVIGKNYFDRTNRDLGKELGLTGQRVGQLYDRAIKKLWEEVTRTHE
jgi:RNA polymerase sigma factor (sigma-70 family)